MKNKLLVVFLGAFLFRIVLAFIVWHPDLNNHIDWGIRFFEYGPSKFFAPESNVWNFTWPNQPPGTIYMYAGIRILFEQIFAFFWWLNVKIPLFPSIIVSFFEDNLYPALLKLPSILSDLGIAYLLYKILKNAKKEKAGTLAAILFLINPVVWYNSAVWGQTDAVINFLALLSFYFLTTKKLWLAIFIFGLSLYVKISLLIFAPIFLVFALSQKFSVSSWIKGIIMTSIIIWLVTIPFSGLNAPVWLYEIYTEKVLTNQLQVITANAFNIWAAITGIHEQPHTRMLGPLSYQVWGLISFSVVFLPTLYVLWKKKTDELLWWSLAITSFASFILLTNMHERYLYPLFPYFTLLAVTHKKLLPAYWLVSGINLINMYNFWWTPRIEPIVQVMSAGNRLMPRILGLINTGIFAWFVNYALRLYHKEKI